MDSQGKCYFQKKSNFFVHAFSDETYSVILCTSKAHFYVIANYLSPKQIRSHHTLLRYSSGINVSDDCLELALKRRIMSIGITAADRNSKTDPFCVFG